MDFQKQSKSKLGTCKNDISRQTKPARRKKQPPVQITTLRKFRLGGLAAISELPSSDRPLFIDRSSKELNPTHTRGTQKYVKLLDETIKSTHTSKRMANVKIHENVSTYNKKTCSITLEKTTTDKHDNAEISQEVDETNCDLTSTLLIKFDSPVKENPISNYSSSHNDTKDVIDSERNKNLTAELKMELQKAKSRYCLLEDCLRRQKSRINEIETLVESLDFINSSSTNFIDECEPIIENLDKASSSSSPTSSVCTQLVEKDDGGTLVGNVSCCQDSEDMLTELRANITYLRTPRLPTAGRLSTVLTPHSMSYCVQEQFKKLFE